MRMPLAFAEAHSMRGPRMQQPPGNGDDQAGSIRRNLVLLAITALVVLAGVWLVNKLIEMRNLQNCLASGRTNCAPITVPGRER